MQQIASDILTNRSDWWCFTALCVWNLLVF